MCPFPVESSSKITLPGSKAIFRPPATSISPFATESHDVLVAFSCMPIPDPACGRAGKPKTSYFDDIGNFKPTSRRIGREFYVGDLLGVGLPMEPV